MDDVNRVPRCVPLEVEPISLHRERRPSTRPRTARRAGSPSSWLRAVVRRWSTRART